MPNPIITENFNAWTKGLTPEKSRISIFNHIRDIPYYLVPQIDDPREWAASILTHCKGSCSPKHYLLGYMFEKLGLEIRYITYPFKWAEQPIKYTAELKELARGSTVGYHAACKANINGRWVLVDATWDKALNKAGFPVNSEWDGVNNTLNAVKPFEEVAHKSLEERLDYVKNKRALWSEEEKSIYSKFIERFNAWLEVLRTPG